MICVVVRGTDCHQLKQFEMACVPASRPGSLAILKKMMDYQLQYASAAIYRKLQAADKLLAEFTTIKKEAKERYQQLLREVRFIFRQSLQLTLFAALASVPCARNRTFPC